MDLEAQEINYLQFIESSLNVKFETISLSNDELRFEIRRRLTKKELKLLLAIYLNHNLDEILERLNLDIERKDELFESAIKKLKSFASWKRVS